MWMILWYNCSLTYTTIGYWCVPLSWPSGLAASRPYVSVFSSSLQRIVQCYLKSLEFLDTRSNSEVRCMFAWYPYTIIGFVPVHFSVWPTVLATNRLEVPFFSWSSLIHVIEMLLEIRIQILDSRSNSEMPINNTDVKVVVNCLYCWCFVRFICGDEVGMTGLHFACLVLTFIHVQGDGRGRAGTLTKMWQLPPRSH
jgi:hypothetical protein